MKKIFSSPDRTIIYNIKNVLENNGIETTVRGENLTIALGEIPMNAWMELWLYDEQQLKAAQQILDDSFKNSNALNEVWNCPKCGEELERQFTQCWKCGATRT